MGKTKAPISIPPTIINVFKPARLSSYDVIRHFKRSLPPGFGKIGHFGTLDPFASGVLLIGVGGAARLNDYVHSDGPKTYLAIGKLGVETETGDLTVAPSQLDSSEYLKMVISKFEPEFIESQLRDNFLGEYYQAPHKYSAAKFDGKPLHFWARSGVEIKKEKVLRFVESIKIVKYNFPYLSIEVTVSSGTYVRTLFSDFAAHLGTIGSLVSLVRTKVGKLTFDQALKMRDWPKEKSFDYGKGCYRPDEVLDYPHINLEQWHAKLYSNGVKLREDQFKVDSESKYYWVYDEEKKLLGMGIVEEEGLKAQLNFSSSSS